MQQKNTLSTVLDVLAWVAFFISIIAYFTDEIAVEPIYFAVVAIFLTIGPRKF